MAGKSLETDAHTISLKNLQAEDRGVVKGVRG